MAECLLFYSTKSFWILGLEETFVLLRLLGFFKIVMAENTGEGGGERSHRVAARAVMATAAWEAPMAGTPEENRAIVETTEAESALAAIQANHQATLQEKSQI